MKDFSGRIGRACRRGLVPAIGLLLAAGNLRALEPRTAVHQYGLRTWSVEEGLPQSTVHAIAQTPDGFLWLGTQGGLARFDGLRFSLVDAEEAIRSGPIRTLAVRRDGSMWVGGRNGAVAVYRAGRFSRATSGGVPLRLEGEVRASAVDQDDALWFATSRGVTRVAADGSTRRFDHELPSPDASALALTSDRSVWIGTAAGLAVIRSGKVSSNGLPRTAVAALASDKAGHIWIGTHSGLLRHSRGVTSPVTLAGFSALHVSVIREDVHGNLWVGTNRGVLRVNRYGTTLLSAKDGIDGEFIKALGEDRGGSLWIGTSTGLTQVRDTTFITAGRREGLRNEMIMAMTEDSAGQLWIGTEGGLGRMRAGAVHWLTTRQGLPNDGVHAAIPARRGGVWIGTLGGGVAHVQNGKKVRVVGVREGLSEGHVLSLLEDPDGSLWIGTHGGGLNHLKNGRVMVYRAATHGFASNQIWTLLPADDGGIWVGAADGGLVHFRNGVISKGRGPDLGPGRWSIRSHLRQSDGTFWLGTAQRGFFHWRGGKATWFDTSRVLSGASIHSLVNDGRGYLWITNNAGVVKFRISDLLARAADPSHPALPIVFGVSSGLRISEFNSGQTAGMMLADGTLLFSSPRGIVRMNPREQKIAASFPPTAVIDQISGAHAANDGTLITEKGARLTFRFTAPDFSAPGSIRFRYRLEGFDRDWVESAGSRSATYTNLPPGNYRFRVGAANADGVWSNEGATRPVRRVPTAGETPLFRLGCAVFLLLLLVAAHRLRLRHVEGRERLLQAMVAERTSQLEAANAALHVMSHSDALTGIANRRRFDESLAAEWGRAARDGARVGVLLLDVDHFKLFNDRYGHDGGDQCLRRVAEAVQSAVRGSDLAARFGGEEFVVLLPGATDEIACVVAERIRSAVSALQIRHESSPVGGVVTVSVGGTSSAIELSAGAVPLDLVRRADAALYAAKESGRNKVVVDLGSPANRVAA